MRDTSEQDERYRGAAAAFGGAIERLARGYEVDAELRRDLVQDVHVALWRSFAAYDGRCSERTWAFRVAHNAAADHVRARHRMPRLLDLADAPDAVALDNPETETDARRTAERLAALVQRLKPADRQVMLLYLEDLDAAGIGEVTGLSAGAVAVRNPPDQGAARPAIRHRRKTMTDDQLKQAWRAGAPGAPLPSLDEVREGAFAFHRRIAARNRREYAACLILPLFFMAVALAVGGTFLLLGAGLVAAGCAFVAWQLGRRAAAAPPPDAAAAPLIAHQRAALDRQRRALAGAGAWYVLPMLPGTLIFTLAPGLDRGAAAAGSDFHIWFPVALILAVALAIWALNLWAARRLAAEIAELDALGAER